ncbi:PIN domain-containing protein [bacterium]|nr:PIN domain-containing protein [bacterium]
MSAIEFVDTNVLIYAHDANSPGKQRVSIELIERISNNSIGAISTQILLELYNGLTRKLKRRMDEKTAALIVAEAAQWFVFVPNEGDVLQAIEISRRHRISIWDAMNVQAAKQVGAKVLWTEDLNDGQVIDAVRIRNPYA